MCHKESSHKRAVLATQPDKFMELDDDPSTCLRQLVRGERVPEGKIIARPSEDDVVLTLVNVSKLSKAARRSPPSLGGWLDELINSRWTLAVVIVRA